MSAPYLLKVNEKEYIYQLQKKYSHGSIDTAKKLLDTRKLDYFELIDYDKLCSIINSKQNIPVWQNLVSSLYSNPDILIYDTEEKIQKYDKL